MALGHSTISITLDVYSHVTPGLQKAAAAGFDEALARPAGAERAANGLQNALAGAADMGENGGRERSLS